MDVAVEVILSNAVDEAVSAEHREHRRLHLRQTQRRAVRFDESVYLGELLGTLRVDERDRFEVEHNRSERPGVEIGQGPHALFDPVMQRR